jgi:hypothetical protein
VIIATLKSLRVWTDWTLADRLISICPLSLVLCPLSGYRPSCLRQGSSIARSPRIQPGNPRE